MLLDDIKKQLSQKWDPRGIWKYHMNPDGKFTFSGVEPEPMHPWVDDEHRYDKKKIIGWIYPVVQDWANPETGEVFRQNEIRVEMDDTVEYSY